MSGGCSGGFLDLRKHLSFAVLRFDQRSNQIGDSGAKSVELFSESVEDPWSMFEMERCLPALAAVQGVEGPSRILGRSQPWWNFEVCVCMFECM